MAECTYCPFNQLVNAVSEIIKTYRVTTSSAKASDPSCDEQQVDSAAMNAVEYTEHKVKKAGVKKAVAASKAVFSDIRSRIENDLLPLFQKVCLKCSMLSDDDNLSRKGQTFIFLEAMCSNGLSSNAAVPGASVDYDSDASDIQTDPESSAGNDDYDPFFDDDDSGAGENQTASDWVHKNAVVNTHYLNPNGSTNLPLEVEDTLRNLLHSFSQLTVFEQNLVWSQLSGQTFADFGSMSWIPADMKRPQSKQLVSVRWDKLVQKFPLAACLRKTSLSKEIKKTTNERSKKRPTDQYVQESLFSRPLNIK